MSKLARAVWLAMAAASFAPATSAQVGATLSGTVTVVDARASVIG